MRILMLGWEFPPRLTGGLGVACEGLTRALDRLGCTVVFARPGSRETGRGTARRIFDRSIIIDLPGVGGSVYPRAGAPAGYTRSPADDSAEFTKAVAAELSGAAKGPFDAVHAHDWPCLAAGRAAADALGVPLVAHVHSTEFDRSAAPAGGFGCVPIHHLERTGLAAADRVVAVSGVTARACRDRYGVPEPRLSVVFNGVSPPPPGRASPASPPVVLFLGRLTAQKGPGRFLAAAQVLASGVEPRATFVIAGEGDQAGQLRDLARGPGLEGRVRFTGFLPRDAVWRAIRRATCLAMTSDAEPFGLAAAESVAAGVPAIVPEHCGVAEALTTLPRVDPRDPAAVAGAIAELIASRARRAQVVQSARRDLKRLTWRRAAEACVAAYRAGRSPAGTRDAVA